MVTRYEIARLLKMAEEDGCSVHQTVQLVKWANRLHEKLNRQTMTVSETAKE